MSSFSTSYLTIEYQSEHHILLGRWRRGVMPFELQQGYAALLEAAAAHNCHYWLLDVQRRAAIDAADVFWILEEFFPRLQPRLGGTTYLAFLMLPHHLAGVLADANIPALSYYEELPYQLLRFTDEEDALQWLEYCQHPDSVPNPTAKGR